MPFAYVSRRFKNFQENLALTERQIADGLAKYTGLTACLNSVYRGTNSTTANSFLIGSWGKDTCIRPPRDVDMYYVLPNEVYYRYEGYAAGGNKQSTLLQEVKRKILDKYPRSIIKGDGPVILADFSGWTVELVPAFLWDAQERTYLVCNTKNGGSYSRTKPHHEAEAVSEADDRTSKNARRLIRMLKCWQANCNVPIKSFYLEILAVNFLDQWAYRKEGYIYYDWMCRDFFRWMIGKANTLLFAPGTYEILYVGDAWKSRAESAYDRAVKATEFENGDLMYSAGDEWQKIFGIDIPRSVT